MSGAPCVTTAACRAARKRLRLQRRRPRLPARKRSIAGDQLGPPCRRVAARLALNVGVEILDMNLDSGSVFGKKTWRNLFLPDQHGLVAGGGESELDSALVGAVGVSGKHQEALRRVAHLHRPGALPAAREEPGTEGSAGTQIALDLSQPPSQPCRIGDG